MPEFLIQQPYSLEYFAMRAIGDWISGLAKNLIFRDYKTEEELSNVLEAIQHYFDCKMPYNNIYRDNLVIQATAVLRYLFRTIKNTLDKEAKFPQRGSMVLNKNISEINNIIGRFHESFLYSENLTCLFLLKIGTYVPSFSKSYMLTGLTYLDTQDFELIEIFPLVKELHNLKVLKCQSSFTDYMLLRLVENCRLIEEMLLSPIDKLGIQILSSLPNLRIFCDEYLMESEVERLLLCCKNIERIDGVQNRELIDGLVRIASSENNCEKRFKLTSLGEIPYKAYTMRELRLSFQMCPLIQELNLTCDTWDEGVISIAYHDLSMFHESPLIIKDLQRLSLHEFSFYSDEVKEVLQVRGFNLTNLTLSQVVEVDFKAVTCILQTCPNLVSLHLNTYPMFADGDEPREMEIPPLYKLKSLNFRGEPPNAEASFLVLSSCPNIEYIAMAVRIHFTDEVILRVLDKNPMTCLKVLTIMYNMLTKVVIDQVMQRCASLKVVDIVPVDYETEDF